jgi:hypothetical protein
MREFYTLMLLFSLIALAGFAYPESVPWSKLVINKTARPIFQTAHCPTGNNNHG